MRLAWVILALAAVGVGAVHLRSQQTAARAEMYRLEAERLRIRRDLWQQQIRLGELPLRKEVYEELPEWPLELVAPGEPMTGNGPIARRDR